MKAAVQTFLEKISRCSPRFICFVGMGIWAVFESLLAIAAIFPSICLGREEKARKDIRGTEKESKQEKDVLGCTRTNSCIQPRLGS